jgi:hypothetical protein
VEQLWQMPLQAKNLFDLDNVAKSCNAKVKSFAEESFVTPTNTPAKAEAELALEVVKHIIQTKMTEAAAAAEAAQKRETRQKILGIMAEKQDEALKSMSMEDLKKQLEAL